MKYAWVPVGGVAIFVAALLVPESFFAGNATQATGVSWQGQSVNLPKFDSLGSAIRRENGTQIVLLSSEPCCSREPITAEKILKTVEGSVILVWNKGGSISGDLKTRYPNARFCFDGEQSPHWSPLFAFGQARVSVDQIGRITDVRTITSLLGEPK